MRDWIGTSAAVPHAPMKSFSLLFCCSYGLGQWGCCGSLAVWSSGNPVVPWSSGAVQPGGVLSKLLVHGQTMDDLGGSYRFTRIPSHVAVRYRFALVKVKRPSNSLILLVVCPALYCPLLPFTLLLFTAFYCPLPALYCPVLLFTAFYCPLPALYGPLLHFTALHCPLLPSTALYCMGQWLIKRSGRYRLGYRLGID